MTVKTIARFRMAVLIIALTIRVAPGKMFRAS
jgi:hypothetical protein